MSRKRYEEHSFYCVGCGQRGIPIQRPISHQHETMHRKKLYCIHCKTEINHIECKTYDDILTFKENYEKGEYKGEAEASVSYVRNTTFGQTLTN